MTVRIKRKGLIFDIAFLASCNSYARTDEVTDFNVDYFAPPPPDTHTHTHTHARTHAHTHTLSVTVEVCAVTNYKVVWGLTVSLAPAVELRGGKVTNGLVGVEALFTPTVECCQNCLRSERYGGDRKRHGLRRGGW